ncbi:MAG: hypothetical protein K0R17_1408 [Rariglobus sp.]|jgi:hypothetical protein|nr:hypothetical protein [Rariglobus sp.]
MGWITGTPFFEDFAPSCLCVKNPFFSPAYTLRKSC